MEGTAQGGQGGTRKPCEGAQWEAEHPTELPEEMMEEQNNG